MSREHRTRPRRWSELRQDERWRLIARVAMLAAVATASSINHLNSSRARITPLFVLINVASFAFALCVLAVPSAREWMLRQPFGLGVSPRAAVAWLVGGFALGGLVLLVYFWLFA